MLFSLFFGYVIDLNRAKRELQQKSGFTDRALQLFLSKKDAQGLEPGAYMVEC